MEKLPYGAKSSIIMTLLIVIVGVSVGIVISLSKNWVLLALASCSIGLTGIANVGNTLMRRKWTEMVYTALFYLTIILVVLSFLINY